MISGQDTQIARFLERIPDDASTQPREDANTPLVVFKTALELTREQEEALVEHVFQRKSDLEKELGRQQVKAEAWWRGVVWGPETSAMTWLAKRSLMEMVYHQQLDWRRLVMGGIFWQGQNVHMPFSRRIVQQMISRANNYFFSTDPYFNVNPMPAPGVDITKAEQADAFAKYKFDRAHVKDALMKGVEKAFIRGEAVMKTRHWTDAIRYETFANVAVEGGAAPQTSPQTGKGAGVRRQGLEGTNSGSAGQGAESSDDPDAQSAIRNPKSAIGSGRPLVAHDGDYIYDTDRWVSRKLVPPDVQQVLDECAKSGLTPEQRGIDMSQYPSVMTLERDPSTSLPPNLHFETRKVSRQVTRYSGPEASNVFPDDFLAPLNAPDLQTADIVMHIYDIPALQLVQMYIDRLKALGQYDPQEFPRVLELIRTAPVGSYGQTETLAHSPRAELREGSTATPTQSKPDPVINIAEVYLTIDVNQDGQNEEVFLMIDLQTRRPIIYDHLPNVFPNSRRPFHVLAINPVEGRWHGIGMMEVFWELQKFVDLSVNRWDLSLSQAGAVTFWHPELTVEGQANTSLRLNTGETYRKRDPKTQSSEIVERVWLHEFKGVDLEKLVQFVSQMMTNMSGVSNVNDAAMAGLNTSKLATGVRNLDKSGQEQFAPFLSHLEPGIISVLESLLYLTLWHMDDVELYHVLEGDSVKPMQIQARNLQYEVQLELSRYKNEQVVAETSSALQTISNFYALPLLLQNRLMPFYRQLLRAYQVQDIDSVLQPTDPQSYGPGGQVPGAEPANAPPQQVEPQGASLT